MKSIDNEQEVSSWGNIEAIKFLWICPLCRGDKVSWVVEVAVEQERNIVCDKCDNNFLFVVDGDGSVYICYGTEKQPTYLMETFVGWECPEIPCQALNVAKVRGWGRSARCSGCRTAVIIGQPKDCKVPIIVFAEPTPTWA